MPRPSARIATPHISLFSNHRRAFDASSAIHAGPTRAHLYQRLPIAPQCLPDDATERADRHPHIATEHSTQVMRLCLCKYTWPGSNWRPSACEADVIATRPQVHVVYLRAAWGMTGTAAQGQVATRIGKYGLRALLNICFLLLEMLVKSENYHIAADHIELPSHEVKGCRDE